jgi:hypothetical protein
LDAKTVAIGFVHLYVLMGSQSDEINSSLASNSGHRESVNSIKVDHPRATNPSNRNFGLTTLSSMIRESLLGKVGSRLSDYL